MLAACTLNHPLAVKLDARSLAGYAREAFAWILLFERLYHSPIHYASRITFLSTIPTSRCGACD